MDITQLLALKDAEELKKRFAAVNPSSGGLNRREFVDLMRVLLAEHVTDELQFVVQAMDLFRQVDLSSKGVITFPEFSDHIMHLDVLSDEAVLFRSFRYKRCLDVLDDFQGNTVSHLSYYPAPVDRLLVVTEKSDHVYLYVPPDSDGDLPRPSVSLGHFAVVGHVRVLACEHLGEDVGVVTSTSTEDESAYYLNYWELPRRNQQDRAVDGVFIATMMNRIRVVNPQTVLFRSTVGLLLTSGEGANCVQMWRITNHRLRPLKKFTVSTRPITCMLELRWLGVGHCVLVLGSKDGSLYLLDMTRLALEKDLPVKQVTVQTIRAHEYGVVALCQSKKHRLMFSAGVFREESTCRVSVWRAERGDQPCLVHDAALSLAGHAYQVLHMCAIDEEDQLITADMSGEIRVWDLPSLNLQQVIYSKVCDRKINPLRCMAVFGPVSSGEGGGGQLLANHPWTVLVASNVVEMHQKARVRQKDSIVASFYNGKFKNFVVVGARRVCMWNAYNGILAKTYDIKSLLQGKSSDITACCLGDDGSVIIFGDDKGRIYVCSYSFGTLLKQLDPHDGPVTWLEYCQVDKTVMSTGADGRVRVLDDRDPDGYIQEDKASNQLGRSVAIKEIMLWQQRPTSRGRMTVMLRSTTTSTPKHRLMGKTGTLRWPDSASTLRPATSASRPGSSHGNGLVLPAAPSPEVLLGACSTEFNMFATVSVNTNEIADVNVWDYETAGLLGTVLEPPDSPGHGSGEDSNSSTTTTFLKTQRVGSPAITTDLGSSVCFAATALAFCTPFPLLAGGTDSGVVHLWKVPSLDYTVTLSCRQRLRRASVDRRRSSVNRLSNGSLPTMSAYGDLAPAGISALVCGRIGDVMAFYAGDEYGGVTAWFLDEAHLHDLIGDEDDDEDDSSSGGGQGNQREDKLRPQGGGGKCPGSPPQRQRPAAPVQLHLRPVSAAKEENAAGGGATTPRAHHERHVSSASTASHVSRASFSSHAGHEEKEGGEEDDGSSYRSSFNSYKKFSRRYTCGGYDAHRNMRIKLPTDRLLLARKLVARRQLARGTTRQTLFSSRTWEAHHDRITGLTFIASSLTLVSAGADNMVHLWDATRPQRLLGTLDLQEPGTPVNAWRYLVIEDEESQKALATQEARKLLLSTKELQRLASRRKRALKKKMKAVKVVVAMGLMEVPTEADMLRLNALQAIKDKPPSAGGSDDFGARGRAASPTSPGEAAKRRRKKKTTEERLRSSTWTALLASARQSEAMLEENRRQEAAKTPTAKELRRQRRLRRRMEEAEGEEAEEGGWCKPASAVSHASTCATTHQNFLSSGDMVVLPGAATTTLPPSRVRMCGCVMRHGGGRSRSPGRRGEVVFANDVLNSDDEEEQQEREEEERGRRRRAALPGRGSSPFRDLSATQYIFESKPATTTTAATASSAATTIPDDRRWRLTSALAASAATAQGASPEREARSMRAPVLAGKELHREYDRLVEERQREDANRLSHVSREKVQQVKAQRAQPARKRKELLITIINKLNHVHRRHRSHVNTGLLVDTEVLRLSKLK